MRKNRLLFILLVLIVLIATVLILVLATHKKNVSQPSLTITNSSTLKGIDRKNLASIENRLLQRVSASTSGSVTHYDATIRSGSLKLTYRLLDGINTPYYTFLVDIPTAQRTYNVTFYGGDGYELSILYVLCPTSSQLIYQAFSCQDEGA